ncbi:MAG: response regulator, partial [Desulfobacterales bacterium]|nr:response regulator [Desulfobacterales bacterium]
VEIRDVKIERIIERLRGQFDPVAEDKGVAFNVEVAREIPESVMTDGQRIEQILKNLLSNAFKFTREGQVRLHIHFPDPGIRFIRADLDPATAMAYSVIDTGYGIPEEKQRSIFEAFQQADGSTSRQFGGTGLGLTISRELSRRLGGEIQLRSEPGKGSVFTLFLPGDGSREPTLSPPAPREAPAAPPPLAAPPARAGEAPVAPAPEHLPDDRNDIHPGDKAILVIEDDIRFARILKDFIREKGYKFLAAENGRSGLDLALRRQPFAIILDIQLPDINGLRVLDHLKSRLETRHIPVYIVSVMEAAADSLKKGAIGHQTKPTSPEAIHEVLTKLKERREKKIKEILVIEDDPGARTAVIRLIENNRTNITAAGAGEEALEKISAGKYDLVILDLGLPDMTGFELLEKLQRKKTDESFELPPVIIYTGRELTRDEHMELRTYTESIVVKGAGSPERLLDEVSLFLHSLESSLPDNQKKIIRKLHDPRMVLKGKRILLVDDDLRNSFALASILEKYSLDVVMADNGRLALEKLDQEESIDLVLMDIMMPVMDGYETIRGVRARPRFKKLPIIALTAKAMPEDRARCMDAGANDYLTKPIDEDKLISMLRIWLYES